MLNLRTHFKYINDEETGQKTNKKINTSSSVVAQNKASLSIVLISTWQHIEVEKKMRNIHSSKSCIVLIKSEGWLESLLNVYSFTL